MITLILPPVIWYEYKGDEICWNGTKYYSMLSHGYFDTLKDMDAFWESCFVENLEEISKTPEFSL